MLVLSHADVNRLRNKADVTPSTELEMGDAQESSLFVLHHWKGEAVGLGEG